jgi:hypothetical protein
VPPSCPSTSPPGWNGDAKTFVAPQSFKDRQAVAAKELPEAGDVAVASYEESYDDCSMTFKKIPVPTKSAVQEAFSQGKYGSLLARSLPKTTAYCKVKKTDVAIVDGARRDEREREERDMIEESLKNQSFTMGNVVIGKDPYAFDFEEQSSKSYW